jgi:small neutral amino acid transporter SnatA (MarC family)
MVGSQKQTLSLSATFTIWVFLSVQTFSTALGSVGIRILKRLAGLKGPLFSVDGLSTWWSFFQQSLLLYIFV